MSWKDEFDEKFVDYIDEWNETHYIKTGGSLKEVLPEDIKDFIEALIKETEQRVLEDCIETLLGCDENCAECEADNPHQDLWCPYRERLEQLREKYIKGVE
jgi:hypothetical protein